LNLFTEELANKKNRGMMACEKFEFRHKPALFSAAKAHFVAPWPAKLASQISVDPGRFSMLK